MVAGGRRNNDRAIRLFRRTYNTIVAFQLDNDEYGVQFQDPDASDVLSTELVCSC